jgi:biopolymer transport protein ExbD
LEYFIDNKPIPSNNVEALLLQAIANKSEPTVVLKVDKTVQIQNLVDLLDIGNRNKIKMVLATESNKK